MTDTTPHARSQPAATAPMPDALRQRGEFLEAYVVRAEEAVAEPFRGITADGQITEGLFPMTRTGVSTSPIQQAAQTLLGTLSPEQQQTVSFPVESDAWRRWSNIHPPLLRHGVCMMDMDERQREAVFELLRASLSSAGFASARDVMRLNETVAEMTGRFDEYGDQRYWISLMGQPSADEPWGWQIDGHHLIINCFVLGDQMVMTPTFMGSEPVYADAGKYAGARVFCAEEDQGLALMRALGPDQQAKALISNELPHDVITTAFRDNFELRHEGIRYDELETSQRGLLEDVLGTYVGRVRDGHAQVKLDEVRRHLADTYFAWIGEHQVDSVFYYRVHSPVILIEFDHQRGVAFRGTPVSRNHVHTVVRTPNGNDYGHDLLRQHYERFKH